MIDEILRDYFCREGIEAPLKVDVVLACLRINTPESLRRAEELVGRPITKCPAAIPPWPPKPVALAPGRTVVSVREKTNPTGRPSKVFSRIKPGMTEAQLLNRGLSKRDIRVWTDQGRIVWKEPA